MGVSMLLFWAFANGAVVFAIRRLVEEPRESAAVTRGATTLAILRQRCASGELDAAHFEQKRRGISAPLSMWSS